MARPSVRRAVLAAVLAAIVVPAAAPLAGTAGWAVPARAADPAAIDLAPTVIRHGPRTDRVVALTFDDGWSPITLRQIYRILVRERVPATFFVTGIYVQRAPALWRQIAAAGFPMANHSYLHRDTRDLSPRIVAMDLARTREVVETATGQAMLPYFRPPYGARNAETDRLAAAAGFPDVVLWDTTATDTERRPTVASVVRSATAGRSGSIVLLHAGPRVTPRALPAIIARYRARGFRFVTLPELLGPPRVGWSPALIPAPPSRSVDLPGEDAAPERADGPTAVITAGGHAVAPLEGGEAPPPALPAPSAEQPSPPARDAAWARRDGTPASVAAFTVAALLILVAGAAVAGRRRRPEDAGAP
ncbi:MAG: polysaccharide deacetylase family protein [Chloroflexota bacterium]